MCLSRGRGVGNQTRRMMVGRERLSWIAKRRRGAVLMGRPDPGMTRRKALSLTLRRCISGEVRASRQLTC